MSAGYVNGRDKTMWQRFKERVLPETGAHAVKTNAEALVKQLEELQQEIDRGDGRKPLS